MAAGHDMRLENIGPQKPNIMEREKDEDTRVRIKEKERDDDGPQLSMGKRKHHHHHTHHHHTHHHHHDDDRFSLDGGPLHVQTLNPNKRAMTPTVTATHHHHHGPPHRHHSPAPPPAKRPKLIVNNDSVLKSVTDCPRYHLGSMLYQPSAEPKPGYSTTSLLPRFEGRENCIFQIRIPRRYLYERERADVCQRRCLWGTDVYTDDSDILAVLIHLEGIDSNLVLGTPTLAPLGKNLEEAGAGRKGRPVTKGKSIAVNGSSNSAGTHDKAGDLIVDILILPPLEKYSSTVRNAIKSRAWLKQHDGMSYMVHQIKEVEPGEAEGRGKSMRKQRLNEREHIRKWGTLPGREGEGGLRGVGRDCWEAKVGA
ncbi:histone deacetylation protein Rxt3-domain-containing protein [Kalaharituber pfeilii]|nr:histone deacetylation protein Rxt3-domain-containing protein [Kalaharituber pfeilii]